MPKPRRVKRLKSVTPKMFIYSEGEKTEPDYIKGYLSDKYKGSALVDFIEIEDIKQNTPNSLIKRIITEKRTHQDNDIHWVSYDREHKDKITDTQHSKAMNLAKQNSIKIAFSSVCIEQWILLHFIQSTAPYSCCDDLIDNSPLKQELRNIGVVGYNKADHLYEELKDYVAGARSRAKKVNKMVFKGAPSGTKVDEIYKLNPYTNFYELLDAIDKFISKFTFNRLINETLFPYLDRLNIINLGVAPYTKPTIESEYRRDIELFNLLDKLFISYLSHTANFYKQWREEFNSKFNLTFDQVMNVYETMKIQLVT